MCVSVWKNVKYLSEHMQKWFIKCSFCKPPKITTVKRTLAENVKPGLMAKTVPGGKSPAKQKQHSVMTGPVVQKRGLGRPRKCMDWIPPDRGTDCRPSGHAPFCLLTTLRQWSPPHTLCPPLPVLDLVLVLGGESLCWQNSHSPRFHTEPLACTKEVSSHLLCFPAQEGESKGSNQETQRTRRLCLPLCSVTLTVGRGWVCLS